MKKYSEEHIIEGCRLNKRDCQEALYRAHFQEMMGLCMRHAGDRDKAMQMLNDGFLRVFKKIDSYSGEGSLRAWIRRIVYHSIADFYRKKSERIRFLVFEERDKSYNRNVLSDLYFEDLISLTEKLPSTTASVFRMYAVEGFKHREIAAYLNISVGTSKWHLSEARRKMKILLDKQHKGGYAK